MVIALVTGGTKGIGLQVALQLGKEKFYNESIHIIVTARSPNEQAFTQFKEEGISYEYLPLDLASDQSIFDLKKTIKEKYGKLDILINNAAVASSPKKDPSLRDSYLDIYSVNVAAVAIIMDEFKELLEQSKHPRIVNVSSTLGSLAVAQLPNSPQKLYTTYTITKSALNMLTIIYSQKFAEFNIKVNATCPGYCATELNGYQGTKTPQEGAKVIVRMALIKDDGVTGGFFNLEGQAENPEVIQW